MVTDSFRLSYHHRLFLLLLVFSWALVVILIAFQYEREKDYKVLQLNSLLQYYNLELGESLTDTGSPTRAIGQLEAPMADTRVSIIDLNGKVVFDNILDAANFSNHLDRPEVQQAIQKGDGYTVRRHSESTDATYFYSATREGDIIIRSAVPYSVTLSHVLDADEGFLWFMLVVTLFMSVVAWFATRGIGKSIARLNKFACMAQRGEKIYDYESFPKGELGEISKNIVMLYAQRERQHEEILRQERDKIRIKKQLTNNINHELKTPLAAMQVCLETLMSHPGLSDDKKQMFIERCWENSERLRALLADVYTLTRLDDGKAAISKERISLREVISEAVSEIYDGLNSGMSISVDLSQDIILQGNRKLMESVFCNLISNALAYSQGSEITISQSAPNTIIFADDGVGIPENHLPHIFERFYRIDQGRSRELGGTGLGLSIVKHAIAFHGGTITASNRKGGGLQFIISFPTE